MPACDQPIASGFGPGPVARATLTKPATPFVGATERFSDE